MNRLPVKVQMPLCGSDFWLIYGEGKTNVRAVREDDVPFWVRNRVKQAQGKAYFMADYSEEKGWDIRATAPTQTW